MLGPSAAGNTPAAMRRVMQGGSPSAATGPSAAVTLGNLPPLHLGTVLAELTPDDDLLSEMLAGKLCQDGAKLRTRT